MLPVDVLQGIAEVIRETIPRDFNHGKVLTVMEAQVMVEIQTIGKANMETQVAKKVAETQAITPPPAPPQLVPAGEKKGPTDG